MLGRGARRASRDGFGVGAGFGAGLQFAGDAGDAGEDGAVVAVAEEAADLGDGAAGVFLQQVHGEVAGVGDVAGAAAAAEVGGRDAGARQTAAMMASASGGGASRRSVGRRRSGESAFSMASGVACAADERDVGEDAVEVALELAHGRAAALGDRLERGVGQAQRVVARFGAEDGEARRRTTGCWRSAARPHWRRERSASLRPVICAGMRSPADDDLLAGGVQVVEGVEELVLELLLAFEELDVVDEEDVGGAVAAAELVELAGVSART